MRLLFYFLLDVFETSRVMSNLNTHSMENTTAVLEKFNMNLGVKRYLQIYIITGMFYYIFYIIFSIIKNELLKKQ